MAMHPIDIEQTGLAHLTLPLFPWKQVIILFILYVIQAIPMGLSIALPLVLQARGASYSDIAEYAVASLPFSLKLLWAPIVDSTQLPGFGRRKSWLIPTQVLCALILFMVGATGWLGSWSGENGDPIKVARLTATFFIIYVLMATQDIAVDGWAIEILPHAYKKYASTCNAIGQTVGTYTSSLVFLFLNDADACNRWFRTEPKPYGLISTSAFVIVCGCIFLSVTIYVGLFVDETFRHAREEEDEPSVPLEHGERVTESSVEHIDSQVETKEGRISDCYSLLFQMMKMWPVQITTLFLLTARLPFAAIDGALHLKLIEAGLKKEEIALISPFVVPWGILASYTAGRLIHMHWTALQAFHTGYYCRLAMMVVWTVIFLLIRDVYIPLVQGQNSSVAKLSFWTLIYICYTLQTMITEFMFACQIAFFAQVSDPTIGGTAMTFFNTIANLGGKYPSMIALYLMGKMQLSLMDEFVFLSLAGFALGITWISTGGQKILHLLDVSPAEAWQLQIDKANLSPRETAMDDSKAGSHLVAAGLLNRRSTPSKAD